MIDSELYSIDEIKNIVKKNNISNYKIAQKTGITQSALGKIFNGKVDKPQEDTILELNKFIKSLALNNSFTSTSPTVSKLESLEKENKVGVPYYDIDFYGGFNKVFEEFSIYPSFYIQNPIFAKAEFAVNLSGRSMTGIIPNFGEIISNNHKQQTPQKRGSNQASKFSLNFIFMIFR